MLPAREHPSRRVGPWRTALSRVTCAAAVAHTMRSAAAVCALALCLCAAGVSGQVYSTLLPAFRCARQDVVCASLGDMYFATRGWQWRNATGWSDAAAGVSVEYCQFAFITCNASTVVTLCVCH